MIRDEVDINIITIILVWYLFVICNFTMLKLKSSFLFKQKRENGVGSPSIYVLFYWLMNKEAVLACDKVGGEN